MSQDHLGLFDTPPERREERLAVIIVGLLLGASLLILPAADQQWRAVPSFVPAVESAILVAELIIAALFYAQAAIFRSRSLTILASGYVFIGVLLIPHALTFPGAFDPDGLLDAGPSTAAWLATFRRIAFPLTVMMYVLSERAGASRLPPGEPAAHVWTGLVTAIALAAAATVIALGLQDRLPVLFVSHSGVAYGNVFIVNLSTIILSLIALAILFMRRKSVLDMWLMVALAVWVIQSLVNLPTHHRFTVGWYALITLMLVSNLIILLALIAESNRLYARLALATAARNRQREADRMSIDAVAAAISHEVGQPLTAVSLNTTVGISSLTARKPNVAKAIESLRAIDESVRRSFDVLKSMRAMFAKEPGWASQVDVNDVVRQALATLDSELNAAKISVQIALAEDVAPILGNRVQLQHVADSLVENALQSLTAARGRRRRLDVRSSMEGTTVLLEVRDNGTGISADDPWRVFETAHGTKERGGIGLALCRTIVEEHGGQIQALRAEPHGAVFQVRLPRAPSAAAA